MKSVIIALIIIGICLVETVSAAEPPSNLRQGQTLENFSFGRVDGTRSQLDELTAKGPVVLVVLRGWPGYQCPLCQRQVGEFLGQAATFKDKHATVLFVYPGPAEKLAEHATAMFKDKATGEHAILAVDADSRLVSSLGLRWKEKGETAYPATLVIDQQRKIVWSKVSRSHGDRANAKEVLAALP